MTTQPPVPNEPSTVPTGAEDTASGAPQRSGILREQLWKYLLENPVKCATTLLLFSGGLLLLLFFLRIGYMPDVNLESLSSLLYAIALLGMFIALYAMLTLVAPGLMLAETREILSGVRPGHVFGAAVGAAGEGIVALCYMFEVPAAFPEYLLPILLVLILLGAPSLTLVLTGGIECEGDGVWNQYGKAFVWCAFNILLLSALLVVALLYVGVLGMTGDIRTASAPHAVLALSALILLIALSAVLVGGRSKASAYKMAAMIALPLLLIVLLVTGSFSAFSAIAVKALGQGEITAARIAVNGKACREVNATLGQRVCQEVSDEAITAICPVLLRSRIGSQVVMDFAALHAKGTELQEGLAFWIATTDAVDGSGGEKINRRVIIDKSKVLAWQPLKGFGERDAGMVLQRPLPSRVATWLEPSSCDEFQIGSPRHSLCRTIERRCGARPGADQSQNVVTSPKQPASTPGR